MDGVLPGNGAEAHPIRPHERLALPDHTTACLLKCPPGILMIDAGPLGPRDPTTLISRPSAAGGLGSLLSTAAR
jgi:hypothetical protein